MTYLLPLLSRRPSVQTSSILLRLTAVVAPPSHLFSRQGSTTTRDKFKPWHPLPDMMDPKTKLGMLRELMTAKRLDA